MLHQTKCSDKKNLFDNFHYFNNIKLEFGPKIFRICFFRITAKNQARIIISLSNIILMIKKIIGASCLLSSFFLLQKKDPECCGIVGALMKQPLPLSTQSSSNDKKNIKYSLEQFLCQGVELLKNRGYDSAGIFKMPSKMAKEGILIKYADEQKHQKNCISRVVEQVLEESGIATSGIAHTRWATCGQKVNRNAHPHFDQTHQIFIVHNGILRNHAEIKNKYLSNVKFTSETDTEVIAQFIGMRRRKGFPMEAVLKQFESIAQQKSQWGLVIIDREKPDSIYTFTNGSPLLIGFSPQQDEIFIASEPIALQKHVDFFFETKDHQFFDLKIENISNIKKSIVPERFRKIDKSISVSTKPPPEYKSFFSYEMRQQGMIKFQPDFDRVKAVKFSDYLSMIACGSSSYAAGASEHIFKKLKCFKKIHIIDPVELEEDDICDDETVLLISQSGETKDLISIIEDCKKDISTIGIINIEGSTLARKVDFPIYIKVGRQTCVAATKSFFHQVLNLAQFATEVAEKKGTSNMQIIEQIRKELIQVPSYVAEIIQQNEDRCKQLAQMIKDKKSVYLLGKRQTMSIAKQAALKIKQLTYIHAEAIGACEMKHGPIALIESDLKQQTVVFSFILNNQTYPVMLNALDQTHSRNAFNVIITDCEHLIEQNYKEQVKQYEIKKTAFEMEFQKLSQEDKKLKQKNRPKMPTRKYNFILNVPHLKHMTHLLSIVPIQLLVEKLCLTLERNMDYPRNLAKTVTV